MSKDEQAGRARRDVASVTPLGSMVTILVVSILVGGVAFAAAQAGGLDLEKSGAVGSLATAVSVGMFFLVGWPLAFRLEERWLRQLPFRFSTGSYLGALGKKRNQTSIKIEVEFQQPIPPERRDDVATTAGRWSQDLRAEFDSASLLIVSKTQASKLSRNPSSEFSDTDPYTNAMVHRVVRSALKGASALHATHPIERVKVRLTEK